MVGRPVTILYIFILGQKAYFHGLLLLVWGGQIPKNISSTSDSKHTTLGGGFKPFLIFVPETSGRCTYYDICFFKIGLVQPPSIETVLNHPQPDVPIIRHLYAALARKKACGAVFFREFWFSFNHLFLPSPEGEVEKAGKGWWWNSSGVGSSDLCLGAVRKWFWRGKVALRNNLFK